MFQFNLTSSNGLSFTTHLNVLQLRKFITRFYREHKISYNIFTLKPNLNVTAKIEAALIAESHLDTTLDFGNLLSPSELQAFDLFKLINQHKTSTWSSDTQNFSNLIRTNIIYDIESSPEFNQNAPELFHMKFYKK